MNATAVEKIARAVLYEGYVLYPYRPSVKTRQRWTFGGLYPREWIDGQKVPAGGSADACVMQTQCLVQGGEEAAIETRVRFLHLTARSVGRLEMPVKDWTEGMEPPYARVDSLMVGGKAFHAWQEGVECDIALPERSVGDLLRHPYAHAFDLPAERLVEPLRETEGEVAGLLIRQRQALRGAVELSAERVDEGRFRLTVRVLNVTPLAAKASREEAMLHSLVSTHTILGMRDGAFASLMDPPPELKEQAGACKNVGTWPILVGENGARDTLLSSPIILYDYPQIAPESPGELFDNTEIDEILTLRILTLTDEEKRAVAGADERAKALLERTEALARNQMTKLHGTFRGLVPTPPSAGVQPWDPEAEKRELEKVLSAGVEFKRGDQVRLHPRGRADIFDLALQGRMATVVSIEQDFEDRIQVAVTVNDDPGQDFGQEGRIGHRFFFSPDEIEQVATAAHH